MRRSFVAVLCLAAVLGLPHLALAQRVTGQIVGTVTDDSGAVLPGVTVTLKGATIVGTQTATTNEQGLYRFVALPPGAYTLTFTLSGFATLNREGIRTAGGKHDRREREPEGLDPGRGGHGRRGSRGGGHHHEPGQHELRQGLGPERAHPALHLLRPHQRRARREPRHRPTTLAVRPPSAPRSDENSYQIDGTDFTAPITRRGLALAQHRRDRGDRGPLPRRARRVRQPARRRLQRRDPPGQNTSTATRTSTTRTTASPRATRRRARSARATGTACAAGGCPYHRDKYNDATVQLSGPIVKDKLWFFGSYQYQRTVFSARGRDPPSSPSRLASRPDLRQAQLADQRRSTS